MATLKAEEACRALKPGELITMNVLAQRMKVSAFTLCYHVRQMDQNLRVRQGATFYYGNKETIAAYRKHIQA